MADEKVALITAGGSGMGAAAARRLAQDGYRVAILSSSGKGEALAEELGGVGVTGSNLVNDDLRRLVDLAMARWGRIDALVNSAGHGPRAPILDNGRGLAHGDGGVFPFGRAADPAGRADHGGAGPGCHRQHLDGLGHAAKRAVPDLDRVPGKSRRLHQDLRRGLCRAEV